VVEAQAIDNVSYFPRGSEEEKLELRNYFGESPIYKTMEEAMSKAYDMERQTLEEEGILEYGVCYLGTFPEFLTDKELKELKIKDLLSTKEGREIVAAAMAQPERCGGQDYFHGIPLICGDRLNRHFVYISGPFDKYFLNLSQLKKLREDEDKLLDEMDKLWLVLTEDERIFINKLPTISEFK
jgi:hypothetical protein